MCHAVLLCGADPSRSVLQLLTGTHDSYISHRRGTPLSTLMQSFNEPNSSTPLKETALEDSAHLPMLVDTFDISEAIDFLYSSDVLSDIVCQSQYIPSIRYNSHIRQHQLCQSAL